MTIAETFPTIDLYARPRMQRQKLDRLNRLECMWIGGTLMVALIAAGVLLREQVEIGSRLGARAAESRRLESQKSGFETARSTYAQQAEKGRGIESTLAARVGWSRLLQAIGSAMTDREALEQCVFDGRTQRAVVLNGSARDLEELQAMLQRLKAIPCLKNVRLMETAADKNLGLESIHFRIEARCDAADLLGEVRSR